MKTAIQITLAVLFGVCIVAGTWYAVTYWWGVWREYRNRKAYLERVRKGPDA